MKNIFLIILSFLVLFSASCESLNKPVQIELLHSDRNFVWSGESVKLVCNAVDEDNDKISYLWKAPAGEFTTKNDTAFGLLQIQ